MKKHKLSLVTRDKETNEIIQKLPLRKFAIVTDEVAGIASVVPTEDVDIGGIVVNYRDGICQIQFYIGYRDANGTFHDNPKFSHALLSLNIRNEGEQQLWDRYIKNKTNFSFDDIHTLLCESGAVKKAGINLWDLPNLESEIVQT